MAGYVCGNVPHLNRRYVRCLLAICWISGLLCGIFMFYNAGPPVASMMRRTLASSVSIVGLLSNLLIPFLFSVYAVSASMPWLIFLICFFEAGVFSFVSAGICVAFGSAGWLVRSMLMLCSGVGASAQYVLWLQLLSGRNTAGVTILFSFLLAMVYACDYYVISPVLASLIIN